MNNKDYYKINVGYKLIENSKNHRKKTSNDQCQVYRGEQQDCEIYLIITGWLQGWVN